MSKTYTLLDNLECESLSINGNYEGSSSFSANGKDITCKWVGISNSFEQSLSVLMGSGTWEAMDFYLDTFHGVVSIESETSTMRITPSDMAGLSSQFTSLGENSFNDIEVSEGAEVEMQTQATTFNSFKIGSGATIDLGGSQINIASLQAAGTDSNPINITGGTLSKPSGFVQCDYLVLADSRATGGAKWYAGENSIDNGGNEGWIFRKRKYQLPARKV